MSACGGTAGQLQHAHRLLATAQRRRQRAKTAARFEDPKQGARAALQQHPATPRHPDYMRTPLDFQQGLQGYRQETGALSVRAIAENAELSGLPITKSTVHRMLTHGMFPQWHQVEALLAGCRPHRLPDLEPWRRAWRRIFSPTAAQKPSPWETVRDVVLAAANQNPSHKSLLYDYFVRSMPGRTPELTVKPTVDYGEQFYKTLQDLAHTSRARPGGR